MLFCGRTNMAVSDLMLEHIRNTTQHACFVADVKLHLERVTSERNLLLRGQQIHCHIDDALLLLQLVRLCK